jgi:RNA polymerase sigma-70 factor (ECF subfamily)
VNANQPTDVELMRLVAAGDRDAFATLVRRHERPLVNFFRRLGADAHEAEDCAQDTFLRLFQYRDRYRPAAPFPVFLHRLARNAWADCFRRGSRWRRNEASGGAAAAGAPMELAADDRLDLEGAVRALPAPLRWVVLLSVHQGLAYAEIAAVLGIPEGTVKSRMFHAVRRLREALRAGVEP